MRMSVCQSELNSEGGPARRIPTLDSLLGNHIHSLILNVIHLTGYVVCVAVYPTAFAVDLFLRNSMQSYYYNPITAITSFCCVFKTSIGAVTR